MTMFDNNKKTFSFVAEVSGETDKMMHANYGGDMPIITLRDNIFFPGTVSPITVGRKYSIKTLRKLERTDGMVALLTQKTPDVDTPQMEDLYPIGVVAKLVHSLKMPDGSYNALFQAFNRIQIQELRQVGGSYEGTVTTLTDLMPGRLEQTEYKAMLAMLKERTARLMSILDDYPDELTQYVNNMEPSTFMLNTICSYLPLNIEQKYELLSCPTELQRLQQAIQFANNIIELMQLKRKIENKTRSDLDQQQREYFLRQQVQNIQSELGDKDESSVRQDDVNNLKEKAKAKHWSKETSEIFEKELAKLSRINVQSPDYNVQLQYLQTVVGLPWDECTRDNTDISRAEKKLNRDHYGMEKVKERVIEYLAVRRMKEKNTQDGVLKGPILCFVGPPGVGKTSIVKGIAKAVGRKFVQMSLGGVRDEAEIRGHRRTYVGAIPGRIIEGMKRAGTMNPVFLFDEIDKMSHDFRGDPASAMLEVLDAEQNFAFRDHYMELPFDLSKVMFITTANTMDTIPGPLLDRMEIIEVPSYTEEEKLHIAKKHLLAKQTAEHGLPPKSVKISDAAMKHIIEGYTREAGVRTLSRTIARVVRKAAVEMLDEDKETVTVSPQVVEKYLGAPRFLREAPEKEPLVGIVNGLAYTTVGGETLAVECATMEGTGQVKLTGQLGDVMKESAMAALSWVRAHAKEFDLQPEFHKNLDIHIHVPEGAVPKDGPSAGVTMATALVSALTGRKVRQDVAMTGEITLRGRVLPIGGVKEKLLAAYRAGIKTILLPKENQKDLEDVPEHVRREFEIILTENIQDVLNVALVAEGAL